MDSHQAERTTWLARWEEWRAHRWLDQRDRLVADIPSWRLLQELQLRGDLIEATEPDLGQSKGGTGKLRIGARPVDRHGLPLWRVRIEDEEVPDVSAS